METTELRERRLRRRTRRHGFRLEKSRRAADKIGGRGYRLVDENDDRVVLGLQFEATLDEIELWLE